MGTRNLNLAFDRLLVDTSYTRVQTGSVGVTRTVRRLLDEFQRAPALRGLACVPVAVHTEGFRQAWDAPAAARPQGTSQSVAARMLRWIVQGRVRNLALACLPLSLQQAAWQRYSAWAFDSLSRHSRPVAFRPGDVLFMPDASWHYAPWPAMRQAREQGARVVLMVHDLIPLRYPEYCAPLVSRVFSKWLTQMLRSCDAVVCNSSATERDLRDHAAAAGLRLPATGHFRLGCDPAAGPTAGLVARPAIADFLAADGACFAAVGSVEPRKNYGWLLEVFELLWSEGHNVRLLIAGRATADDRALTERLKNHPRQGEALLTVFDASDGELDLIYSRARALLFPSLAEGFGLPLVEARTRACPVIATDLPVFRELADAGVSLYPKNSIEGLEALVLAHAAVDRRTLVEAMPAFTWRDSVEQLLKTVTIVLDPTVGPMSETCAGARHGSNSAIR